MYPLFIGQQSEPRGACAIWSNSGPPPPLPGIYSSPCGSKYFRDGPVTHSPPSQPKQHIPCTRQSNNSRKQDTSSIRGYNKWAAGHPPSSTGHNAKNGKRTCVPHRWQSHTRCRWTSTPPPPCISYALVRATVGVGTVIIVYVILIAYEM